MPSSILPSDEEARALAVGPESITWRRAGDARTASNGIGEVRRGRRVSRKGRYTPIR